jgi:hypothetical protein
MIDLFDLYERFRARVNTHQGGHASPQRVFLGWVKDINIELFNEYYKAYEKNKDISDKLSPFYQTFNVVVTSLQGQMYDLIKRPAGYSRIGSIRIYRIGDMCAGYKGNKTIDCNGVETTECPTLLDQDELFQLQASQDAKRKEIEVDRLDSARWGALSKRISKGPTIDAPKFTLYDQGFKIAPKRLGVVIVDFFRLPVEPTFAYTIINPGQEDEAIQYNQAQSVKLEWDPTLIPEFLSRLEVLYGAYIRNPLLMQQGKEDKVAST